MQNPSAATNPFVQLWEAGYRSLIPITPPDAAVSPGSTLYKRPKDRGKAPGVRNSAGLWHSFNWPIYQADEADCASWFTMGAGTGIKLTDELVAIDADTLSPQHAQTIYDLVCKRFGVLPCRIGRKPKALYPIRVSAPFRYARIEFEDIDGSDARVEILSRGRQFVAYGIHPVTREPYHWATPLPKFEELPTTTPEALLAFLEELRAALPKARPVIKEGADTPVNQESLKGELKHVARAVAATPNTSALFPTRESYRDYGYAIKAALPDDPDEALVLFENWCGRWTDGHNDPDIIKSDWARMKPPFRRGATYLYELADKHGDHTAFSIASVYLDPIDDTDDKLGLPPERADARPAEPFRLLAPSEWAGNTPPEREWEVEGFIPRHEVTLLYGDGGVGKSLLIQQYATAAAAGLPWIGLPTAKAKVLAFLCEDDENELHRRQVAINASLLTDYDAFQDNLRFAPRKFMDNALAQFSQSGTMKLTAVWDQLRQAALDFGASVIITDTLADIYTGSEIDRSQVNNFVKACLGRLGRECNATVIALGHPSMAGKSSGAGTSGSTAWSNAVRSRLYLRYPKGAETGNIRELEGMKTNYSAKGGMLKLRWSQGAFEPVLGIPPRSENSGYTLTDKGSEAGNSAMFGVIDAAAEKAVRETLLRAKNVPLSLSPRAQNYAPRVLKMRETKLLEAFTTEEVGLVLQRMQAQGMVQEVTIGSDNARRSIRGLCVREDDKPQGFFA